MFKKRDIILFSKDRLAVGLLGVLLFEVLILCLTSLFNTRVSDIQIPTRYTGYGFTNFYREQWYALLSFGLFGVIAFVTNGFLAFKLHSVARGFSLAVLALGIFVCGVAVAVANLVFHLTATLL